MRILDELDPDPIDGELNERLWLNVRLGTALRNGLLRLIDGAGRDMDGREAVGAD